MRKLTLLILSFLPLLACAQQSFFSVNVRVPAKINIASYDTTIHTILLVNNSVMQPDDFGHQNKRNDVSTGTDNIDLKDAARQFLFGLETGLSDQEAYDEVSLLEVSQNESDNFYSRKALTSQQVDSLCDLYGTDAVLALNQLVLYDLKESFLTDNETYYAYLQAFCSSQWKLQRRGARTYKTFTSADTLIWEAEKVSEEEALRQLPNRQTALIDFAYYSGELLSHKIVPQWETQDRYLYAGKDERFQTALGYFSRQRWQDANTVWLEIYNDNKVDKTQRAYAAANIAVALELQESFKLAIAWVDLSVKLFSSARTSDAMQQVVNMKYYRTILEQRKDYHF